MNKSLAEYDVFSEDIKDLAKMKLEVFKFMFKQGTNWKIFTVAPETSVVARILSQAKSVEDMTFLMTPPTTGDEDLLAFYKFNEDDLKDIAIIKRVFDRI